MQSSCQHKLINDSDIHEEVIKWLNDEIETFQILHLSGETHEYDVENFAREVSAIHAAGAPTVEQYQQAEHAPQMAEIARTFLTSVLEKRAAELPDPSMLKEAERVVTLRTIDQFWMEHIDAMAHLRDEVNFRAYAQKNPLHEYQREGYEMFVALLKKIHGHVVRTLFQMNIEVKLRPAEQVVPKNVVTNASAITAQLVNTGEYQPGVSAAQEHATRFKTRQRPANPNRIRAEADDTSSSQQPLNYTQEQLQAMPRAERRRVEKMMKKQK